MPNPTVAQIVTARENLLRATRLFDLNKYDRLNPDRTVTRDVPFSTPQEKLATLQQIEKDKTDIIAAAQLHGAGTKDKKSAELIAYENSHQVWIGMDFTPTKWDAAQIAQSGGAVNPLASRILRAASTGAAAASPVASPNAPTGQALSLAQLIDGKEIIDRLETLFKDGKYDRRNNDGTVTQAVAFENDEIRALARKGIDEDKARLLEGAKAHGIGTTNKSGEVIAYENNNSVWFGSDMSVSIWSQKQITDFIPNAPASLRATLEGRVKTLKDAETAAERKRQTDLEEAERKSKERMAIAAHDQRIALLNKQADEAANPPMTLGGGLGAIKNTVGNAWDSLVGRMEEGQMKEWVKALGNFGGGLMNTFTGLFNGLSPGMKGGIFAGIAAWYGSSWIGQALSGITKYIPLSSSFVGFGSLAALFVGLQPLLSGMFGSDSLIPTTNFAQSGTGGTQYVAPAVIAGASANPASPVVPGKAVDTSEPKKVTSVLTDTQPFAFIPMIHDTTTQTVGKAFVSNIPAANAILSNINPDSFDAAGSAKFVSKDLFPATATTFVTKDIDERANVRMTSHAASGNEKPSFVKGLGNLITGSQGPHFSLDNALLAPSNG